MRILSNARVHKNHQIKNCQLQCYSKITKIKRYTNNTLTTDVSVKLRIYTLLLTPLAVSPPNNIALELLIDVKVKE